MFLVTLFFTTPTRACGIKTKCPKKKNVLAHAVFQTTWPTKNTPSSLCWAHSFFYFFFFLFFIFFLFPNDDKVKQLPVATIRQFHFSWYMTFLRGQGTFSPLHPYTHRTQRLVWVPWCDSRNRRARCAVAHVRLRWRRRRRLVAVGENFLFSSLAWQLGRRKGLFLDSFQPINIANAFVFLRSLAVNVKLELLRVLLLKFQIKHTSWFYQSKTSVLSPESMVHDFNRGHGGFWFSVIRHACWRLPLDHLKKALTFAQRFDECAWTESIMLFE